jgi:N-acetylmuramoyl-L-alanine amidase
MKILASLTLVSMLSAASALAQDADRDLFLAAMAREHAVRATFAGTPAPDAALKDVHGIVTAYQALVRRFPASGYSDDALWQAGRLELDAFARFGESRDKDVGVRLLQRLAADYPTSKLAKRVPETMATLKGSPHVPESTKTPEPVRAPVAKTAPLPPPIVTKPIPAAYGPPAPAATIRSIKRTVLPDVVRVVIEIDGEVPFHDERIGDPDRLFVDLSPAQTVSALSDQTLRFASDSDIVRQVRLGKQPNRTTRIVLDAGGVSTYSIYALYEPYRLVIDCVRGPRPAPPPLAIVGRYYVATWARKLPAVTPHATALIQAALAGAPAADAVTASATPAPDKNATGGFSISRQLGLGVSRIVIDPGHGGHDPGAMGNGVSEAELVLDIALRLEKLLQRSAGTEVVLTRRTDDFVSLPERTAIANREAADLFLSIHANASEDGTARGVETYFLNFANNLSAASVAARENAASGQSMGALPDFVKAIALNNKLDESRDFATYVQRSMVEKLRATNKTTKDLGVKQAPFVVLIGAAMPSVLAEISFVTNSQEAKLLKSSAYRQRIADALFAAVKKYQTSLRSTATVARQ